MAASAEDQEMMARISQLAGQINRHKNQQAALASAPSYHYTPYSRMSTARSEAHNSGVDGFGGAGLANNSYYPRGGYSTRGHRGSAIPPHPHTHRHRTLVMNGGTQARAGEGDSGATSDASSSSWITKSDRHLQLINSSVYEKDTQARTRAIEETRRQKAWVNNDRERAMLFNRLTHMANGGGYEQANQRNAAGQHEIVIHGIRFLVAGNGSKLVKAPGDNNAAKATPKTAVVCGVKFYRSKNGNLYRHGIVKAQRRSGAAAVKKINMPCRMFSTTGSCTKGPLCRYIHDPSRVAACKDFLLKGDCVNGDACDLSHDLTPERTPTCLHFVKDSCTKPNCKYAHVKVSPGALVCRSFGLYGYCEKGVDCPERHAFECPDFSNTGVCKTKGCKLLHRERASVMRKASNHNHAADATEDAEMGDLSSDDDGDSVDSRDVDSDEVEEFIGQDDALTDFDVGDEPRDFIEL